MGSTIGVNHWGEEAGLQSDTRRMGWGHFGALLRVGLGVPCGVLGPLMGSIVGSTIGVNHWGEDTRRMRWGHFGATLMVGLGVPCGVLGPLMGQRGSIVGSTIGVNHWDEQAGLQSDA